MDTREKIGVMANTAANGGSGTIDTKNNLFIRTAAVGGRYTSNLAVWDLNKANPSDPNSNLDIGIQLVDEAGGFQPRQGNMDGVGPGASKSRPAEQTARPIALAGILAADKGLVADRWLAFPVAIAVAVIGNARCGAATGTGQDK